MSDAKSLTGEQLRAIRKSLGMTQTEFWGAICVSLQAGIGYELGKTKMGAPTERLAWLHYVVGIPTDAPAQLLAGIAARGRAAVESARVLDKVRQVVGEGA